MKEYNELTGVPRFCYYLEETVQFLDFETPEIKKILYVSRTKQPLIDLCLRNNWACYECKNADSWYTHEIKWRSL